MSPKLQPTSLSTTFATPETLNVFRYRKARLNQRLLIGMLCVLVPLGYGVHRWHKVQSERNVAALRARAASARERNEFQAEVHYLSQYLRFRSTDYDVLAELGNRLALLSPDSNTQTRAFLTWEEVLRRDPERTDQFQMRQRIVEVAIRLNRWPDAIVHLQDLRQQDPKNAEWISMLAVCHEATGKFQQAIETCLGAIQLAPNRIEYYVQLAQLLKSHPSDVPYREQLQKLSIDAELREQFPERDDELQPSVVIDRFLEMMVDRGQPAFRALMARAAFAREHGQLAMAEEDLDRALTLAGQEPDVRLMTAELSLNLAAQRQFIGQPSEVQGFVNKARDEAGRGLSLRPDDQRFELLLAEIEHQAGNLSAAETRLRNALKRNPELQRAASSEVARNLAEMHVSLQWHLTDLLITRCEQTTAATAAPEQLEIRRSIDRIRQSGVMTAWADFLDARMAFLHQEWRASATLLESIRSAFTKSPEMNRRIELMLSSCHARLHNPEARLAVLRRATNSDPNWIPAKLELASTLHAAGRIDEAQNAYQALMEVRGVPTILARIQVDRELAKPSADREWSEANRLLNLAERNSPDDFQIPIERARILAGELKYDDADRLLTEAQVRFAQAPELWSARVRLALHRPDREVGTRLDEAQRLLQVFENRLGVSWMLLATSAERAMLQSPDQAGTTLTELGRQAQQLKGVDQAHAWHRLAIASLQAGQRQLAVDFWRRQSQADQTNLDVRLIIAELIARESDPSPRNLEWEPLLKEIRAIEGPDGPNGNYLDALWQLKQVSQDARLRQNSSELAVRLSKTRALLLHAQKQRPVWSGIPRALGSLELLLNRRDEALTHIRQALDLGDHSPQVIAMLVEHYREQHKLDLANELLMQVVNEQPEAVSGDVARVAWQLAWQHRQYDEALRLARNVFESTGDYRDQIWSGHLLATRFQLLTAEQQREESAQQLVRDAREAYRRATEVAPDQPSAWYAYLSHLVRFGEQQLAESVLEQARGKLPDSPPQLKPFHMALFHEVLNQQELARQSYLRAVAAAPDDIGIRMAVADFAIRSARPDAAQEHLTKLLDPATGASREVVSWARVRQALALAARGGYADQTKALEMLAQSMAADDQRGRIEILRSRIEILRGRRTYLDRLDLISTYEKLQQRGAVDDRDRFELAKLYDLTGNWVRARQTIEQLLEQDPANANYLEWFSERLLRHEGHNEQQWLLASDYVAKLKAVAPNSYRAVTAQAYLLAARSEQQRAAVLVHDHVLNRQPIDFQGTPQQIEREATVARLGALLCEDFGQSKLAEELGRIYVERATEPTATLFLATLLARQGEIDRALQLCEQAISSCPLDDVAAIACRVVSFGTPSNAQLASAERLIHLCLRKQVNSRRVRFALAGVLMAQGQNQNALGLYRQLQQEYPADIGVLNNLARLLSEVNPQDPEALQRIEQAVELAGPISDLLDTRAWIKSRFKESQSPLDDLKAAIASEPQAPLMFHLAEAQAQAGDLKQARQTFEQAISAGLRPQSVCVLEQKRLQQLTDRLQLPPLK